MERDLPLLRWLEEKKHPRDYEWLARQVGIQSADSMRLYVHRYRLPSWDLAFRLEAVTGISAHDLRDPSASKQTA